MRTFLNFVIVIDPRQVGLAVLDSTQTQHTKNIQAFHYNRTLFVADDRRTRLLRGRSIASSSFIFHGLFSAGERAGGRPVPQLGRTKASPENSARAGWARLHASSLFLAVCKHARYNAAPVAAVPTCCCLVRVAPTRWPRAVSNIHSPTTDNCRCSSEICDLSVIYRLLRRTLYGRVNWGKLLRVTHSRLFMMNAKNVIDIRN